MKAAQLIEILKSVRPDTDVGFEDEYCEFTDCTHVVEITDRHEGVRVRLGSNYSSLENYYHPGNGNLGDGTKKLLGHCWESGKS